MEPEFRLRAALTAASVLVGGVGVQAQSALALPVFDPPRCHWAVDHLSLHRGSTAWASEQGSYLGRVRPDWIAPAGRGETRLVTRPATEGGR